MERFARAAVLCNEADLHHRNSDWMWRGDAVDVAFLSFAHKLGHNREASLDSYSQVNQIPFEPERQFAASYHTPRSLALQSRGLLSSASHDAHNPTLVFVKGAPERVLAMCSLSPETARQQMAAAEEMARRGYRVLALAEGEMKEHLGPSDVPPTPSDLTLLGFAGMIDPLRPGVRDAVRQVRLINVPVAEVARLWRIGQTLASSATLIGTSLSGTCLRACRDAGVRVCMVTGDHRVTALAIARELGIVDNAVERVHQPVQLESLQDSPFSLSRPDKLDGQMCPSYSDQVVTGGELLDKSPDELRELVQRATVFARVAPQQKLQIVEAVKKAGHFVAVTGDGVNDAPALRAANIGVAMGKSGTDVAREAAELVISDDNFATIVAGVEEGRIAYDNVRKVILLLVSCGAAEILLVALAVVTGTPLPLLPVQLLWLNLVTNGIQDVALAFEPGEDDVLRRKPRPPRERIFNRLMIERTIVGALVMGGVAFAAFYWLLQTGMSEATSRNVVLLLMVLFESVQIGNCRSETQSAFWLSPLRSPILLTATVLALLVHAAALYLPIGQHVLKTEPVGVTTWVVLTGLALTVFVAVEFHKFTWAWRNRGLGTS